MFRLNTPKYPFEYNPTHISSIGNRVELEVTERLLEEQTERVVELAPRAMELEQDLSDKT